MKYQNLSQNLNESKRRFILLYITKELIKHSGGEEILKLENILKKRSEERQRKIVEGKKLTNIYEKSINPKEELIRSLEFKTFKHLRKPQKARKSHFPILRIPTLKLPPRFQYLRPTPTKTEIDLGKLNPLAKDPLVKNIECDGPNKSIMVEGRMGRKKTGITLNREEIDEIIDKFSTTAKIPVSEGVFKVAVGRFVFSAIISEIIGSKFIIRKIVSNPNFRQ